MMNPRYSLYTSDKTSPRGFGWIWYLRPAQALISLLVLALAAWNIAGLAATDDFNCSIPGKMGWNLACAVLSLIALTYLLLSSGTIRTFRILPWWVFIQLGLDALMFIFWIAAAGTSHFTCEDLCDTCVAWGYIINYDRLSCSCNGYSGFFYEKRGISPNPNLGLSGGLEKRRSRRSGGARSSGTLIAREALDAIMVVLFFITLVGTGWWIWQNRKAGDTTAPSTNPENGVQQVPVEEAKQDMAYNNGAPQQAPIPPVSPVNGSQDQYPPQQQAYTQQPPQSYQGYPQQGYPQEQQGYQPQQQSYPQQSYPEQQPPMGYYGGSAAEGQHREVAPQHHNIPSYPTPTPEMQAEHKTTQ